MIIFDGVHTAAHKERAVAQAVAALESVGKHCTVGAIVFEEDAGSQLYTRLKSEAAARVGITYVAQHFSLCAPIEEIISAIQILNADPAITGIIIQKPTKKIWQSVRSGETTTLVHESMAGSSSMQSENQEEFAAWWRALTSSILPSKDVDGLHPSALAAIATGTWEEQGRVLPATCQAVVEILQQATAHVAAAGTGKVIIIGKSDLLGVPLYSVLKGQGRDVELLTRKDLQHRIDSGRNLFDGSVIVSATGVAHLVTGELLRAGAVLVDVGEPRPDIDRSSVAAAAAFLTPVPGGVGPMTVVCLLENATKLVARVDH